jgi:hypothetical protein
MKIITKKVASKNGKSNKFLVMNKKEWLDIGKKAGFIKTQAKKTKHDIVMREYMDKMEYVNDVLSQTEFDGTLKITDDEVLALAKKATGQDFKGVSISPEMVRTLRQTISDKLKSDLNLRGTKKIQELSPEYSPEDVGELSLMDQIKKENDEEPPVDTSQIEEAQSEILEGKEEEKAIEQDAADIERRKGKKKRDIAGAIHPLDQFDEAVIVAPNGSSTIEDEAVLNLLKDITGQDYSGVTFTPETISDVRKRLEEHFRPTLSEDDGEDSELTDLVPESFSDESYESDEEEDPLPPFPPR